MILQQFLNFIIVTNALPLFQDKDEQTRLEMKHRKEEDDLYRKFARQREEEDKRMKEEFRVSMKVIVSDFKVKVKYTSHCTKIVLSLLPLTKSTGEKN